MLKRSPTRSRMYSKSSSECTCDCQQLEFDLSDIYDQFTDPPEIPDWVNDRKYDQYEVRPQEVAAKKSDTYCSCKNPNTYKNYADNVAFWFCKTCKKERL